MILHLTEPRFNVIYYITDRYAIHADDEKFEFIIIAFVDGHRSSYPPSVLLYKGANIHSVFKRWGYADIQTTLDHYAHVLKEMDVRDVEIAVKTYAS
ncbi:site-specific integrase [Sporosarcina obsidiansis]|uniref:integrase n=1 Tax=Sporosarcina obsidiansis TaxID=2660748 RepID=UPI001E4706FC|nr:integrase [Sporosarcina obsidiansis]